MANILLVEPDRKLGQVYQTALSQAGHNVQQCRSGQAAIMAVDRHAPDVVILELQLARHNGIEFLYEFRSYPEWQSIPVIVHSLVPSTQAGMAPILSDQFGVVAYHYKPLTKLRDLLVTINQVLVPTV